MTQLKLTNTLTRQKQEFIPLDKTNVGMYVCGITPYDDAHIGHARVYVVFDVLFRLLRHLYGEQHVTYVRNFTDIDDKIITRAAERGENPTDLAQRYISSFHADMAALNVLPPTFEPRVSDPAVMQGIVTMVDDLIAKGYAYATPSGDVMYSVPKFNELACDAVMPAQAGIHEECRHPFGYLDRRAFDKVQARIEEDAEKRDPRDFAVWKANAKSAAKLEQAFNPADYAAKNFSAPGRPGWHIECSVMSAEHLGLPFDIHGGGEDLKFPHHCCEIAQSEALMTPGQNMANYWVHNSFITVNGTKMSKSLGNFTTIKDALQNYSPEAIRLWLIKTHYRDAVDYTEEALETAENEIRYLINAASKVDVYQDEKTKELIVNRANFVEFSDISETIEPLLNDLNTKGYVDRLLKLAELANRAAKNQNMFEWQKHASLVATALKFLGINDDLASQAGTEEFSQRDEEEKTVYKIIQERNAARAAKNWPESDRLRDELKAQGIIVEDKPDGTTTWRRA